MYRANGYVTEARYRNYRHVKKLYNSKKNIVRWWCKIFQFLLLLSRVDWRATLTRQEQRFSRDLSLTRLWVPHPMVLDERNSADSVICERAKGYALELAEKRVLREKLWEISTVWFKNRWKRKFLSLEIHEQSKSCSRHTEFTVKLITSFGD